jgi:hypothetical protein
MNLERRPEELVIEDGHYIKETPLRVGIGMVIVMVLVLFGFAVFRIFNAIKN